MTMLLDGFVCPPCNASMVINGAWTMYDDGDIMWMFTLTHCWHCDQEYVDQRPDPDYGAQLVMRAERELLGLS